MTVGWYSIPCGPLPDTDNEDGRLARPFLHFSIVGHLITLLALPIHASILVPKSLAIGNLLFLVVPVAEAKVEVI